MSDEEIEFEIELLPKEILITNGAGAKIFINLEEINPKEMTVLVSLTEISASSQTIGVYQLLVGEVIPTFVDPNNEDDPEVFNSYRLILLDDCLTYIEVNIEEDDDEELYTEKIGCLIRPKTASPIREMNQ